MQLLCIFLSFYYIFSCLALKQKFTTGGGRKGMQSHGVTGVRMKDIILKTSDGPFEAVFCCQKKSTNWFKSAVSRRDLFGQSYMISDLERK